MIELLGEVGTGAGRTTVSVRSAAEDAWEVSVYARWMGDAAPLEVTFTCDPLEHSTHYDKLRICSARDAEGADVPLPPADGALVLELIRIPEQAVRDPFNAVIWLHPQSYYDPGDQLPVDEYDIPPERFRPAARALAYLENPWKLRGDEAASR